MIGQTFGKLTVVGKAPRLDPRAGIRWITRCECGETRINYRYVLERGVVQSCGSKGCKTAGRPTHGMTGTDTYTTWSAIVQRCTNPKATKWNMYGARGITVCERWLKFANFLEDMGERPSREHTIDRIDGRGNYNKANCRWATALEQQANIAHNVMVTYQGKTQHIMAWARELGIPGCTISHRLLRGAKPEDALRPFSGKRPRRRVDITFAGKTMCMSDWARHIGVSPQTIAWRLKNWPIEKALS